MAYLKCLRNVSTTSIPDGSTVTPTDDIQTLLNCANIWDKSYTTLTELLADTTSLNTVITSNNAIDYLVRSTTWATDMCADSTAMSYIGLNNYASNTLLGDATWKSAICQSTYMESVLNVKVPTMTGYTTPSGEASASGTYSTDYAWKAFDGVNSPNNRWSCDNSSGAKWLQYQFANGIKAYMIEYSVDSHSAYSSDVTFSGDNNTLATVPKPTVSGTLIKQILDTIRTSTAFKWSYTASGICGVRYLQIYGRADV